MDEKTQKTKKSRHYNQTRKFARKTCSDKLPVALVALMDAMAGHIMACIDRLQKAADAYVAILDNPAYAVFLPLVRKAQPLPPRTWTLLERIGRGQLDPRIPVLIQQPLLRDRLVNATLLQQRSCIDAGVDVAERQDSGAYITKRYKITDFICREMVERVFEPSGTVRHPKAQIAYDANKAIRIRNKVAYRTAMAQKKQVFVVQKPVAVVQYVAKDLEITTDGVRTASGIRVLATLPRRKTELCAIDASPSFEIDDANETVRIGSKVFTFGAIIGMATELQIRRAEKAARAAAGGNGKGSKGCGRAKAYPITPRGRTSIKSVLNTVQAMAKAGRKISAGGGKLTLVVTGRNLSRKARAKMMRAHRRVMAVIRAARTANTRKGPRKASRKGGKSSK